MARVPHGVYIRALTFKVSDQQCLRTILLQDKSIDVGGAGVGHVVKASTYSQTYQVTLPAARPAGQPYSSVSKIVFSWVSSRVWSLPCWSSY